ncbi:NTP transferase domain-containing protein [Chryseolinea sp. T2]|uniref:NTP transferase domain-containing protein n=1 Tax=Chryseolinea sp. T2 TaxID=3129255 RepID=UPI0030769243
MDLPLLNGLVLAGGLSTRMGSDKSLIAYHGKPQREYLFELLRLVCKDVCVSCRRDTDVPSSLNPLPDKFEIRSPLNGILSAFEVRSDRAWLTVPVDLPNISGEVFKSIVSHRDATKLATCFFDSSAGSIEPLLAIWEPGSQALLAANAAKGDISPRSFLLTHDVKVVYGMDHSIFLNVNDPTSRDAYASANLGK